MWAQRDCTTTDPLSVALPAHGPDSSKDVGHVVLLDAIQSPMAFLRNSFGLQWGAQGRFSITLAALATSLQTHSAVVLQSLSFA
jgi:hypothetical protein